MSHALTLTGKSLGVRREWVDGPSGRFESIDFGIQTGEGFDLKVEFVRPSRDFPVADFPKDGEDISLAVVVSPYSTRQGAGYRLIAMSRVRAGSRVASVPASASA
jgi:hypothetical protein